MKFSVDVQNLKRMVKAASSCISGKTFMPILSGLLLEADSGGLKVTATDLTQYIRVFEPAEVEEPGRTVVYAKPFLRWLGLMKDGAIEGVLDGDALKFAYENGEMAFATLDPDEYPVEPEGKIVTECIEMTREQWEHASRALPRGSDARAFLSGVCVDFSGEGVTLVSTDTFRLAAVTVDRKAYEPRKFIVPEPGFLPDLFRLDFMETHARFTWPGAVLYTRLIEGQFPNWRNIVNIPEKRVKLDAGEVAAAIQRLAVVSTEDHPSVDMVPRDGGLEITVESEAGRGRERILCEEWPCEVRYRARYLLDALECADGEVEWAPQALGPTALLWGDEMHLVMPLSMAQEEEE